MRIFERFARADAARTRSTGGVGLGLAIVDAIAKAHGGRCTVQNNGRGSVFALELAGIHPDGSAGTPSLRLPEPRSPLTRQAADRPRLSSCPAYRLTVHEQRRRGHDPGSHPGPKSRLTRVAHRVAAPVGVEALEVEPERPGTLPQVRILEPALVGEQQVVHLPEAALEPRRLGGAGRGPRARMARAHREMTEHRRSRSSPSADARGAVRALEVRVLDHQRGVVRPAGGPRATARGRARSRARSDPRRRQSRPSKIRFAPGRSRATSPVAPVHDAVRADDHQRALGKPARVIDAERPAGRALGLEVRELLDGHAELLPKRGLRLASRHTRRRTGSRPAPKSSSTSS